jgi:hypothetical protein
MITTWELPRSRRLRPALPLAALLAVVVFAATVATDPHDPALQAERSTEDAGRWRSARRGLWAPMPPPPIVSRIGHAIAGHDGQVLVWGGFDVRGRPLDDGAVFDVRDGTWTRVPSGGPGASEAHVVWLGDRIAILSRIVTRIYDPVARTWEQGPLLPLGAFEYLVETLIVNGTVIARTRTITTDPFLRSEFHAWRPDLRQWYDVPAPPFDVTESAAVVANGASLVVASPRPDGQIDLAEINPSRRRAEWRAAVRPPRSTRPITRLLAVSVEGRVVLVGATANDAAGYAAVGGASGAWRRLDAPPVAITRDTDLLATAHDAVVWDRRGGDGASLAAATGRWRRIPPSFVVRSVPTPATGSGSDLLVWGALQPTGAVMRLP